MTAPAAAMIAAPANAAEYPSVGAGEAGGERAGEEDRPAGREDPPGAEQAGQASAEQQQAAEGDDVGVEDPGQVLR
jgi:hypothetical protein